MNIGRKLLRFSYTSKEAMKIVLSDATDKTLHTSELAGIIYKYVQKNGEKAKSNQIRVPCRHVPDMFEPFSVYKIIPSFALFQG